MKRFIILLFLISTKFSFTQVSKEKIIDSVYSYVKITKIEESKYTKIEGVGKYKDKDIIVYNSWFNAPWPSYDLSVGIYIYRKVYIVKETINGKTIKYGKTRYDEFLVPIE
jgi:hypothetical protein